MRYWDALIKMTGLFRQTNSFTRTHTHTHTLDTSRLSLIDNWTLRCHLLQEEDVPTTKMGVILEQEYHNNVQFSVLQEGQCLEEPDLYAYPRVPNPTYARERNKVKVEIPTLMRC